MRISTIALLPLIALTVSCGGSSGAATESGPLANRNRFRQPSATTPNRVTPTICRNCQKAYDLDYYVPQGFFVDVLAETETRSYTVHHVLDETRNFELCSDDLTEAQGWEAADNASRAVNGYLVTILTKTLVTSSLCANCLMNTMSATSTTSPHRVTHASSSAVIPIAPVLIAAR